MKCEDGQHEWVYLDKPSYVSVHRLIDSANYHDTIYMKIKCNKCSAVGEVPFHACYDDIDKTWKIEVSA
jgi:hypothetical protein